MIVRKVDDMKGSRVVSTDHWLSRRLLLRDDGMGFSLHDTVIHPKTSTRMRYSNHLEAVYCIAGKGSLIDIETERVIPLEAGTLYALNGHEEHILTAESELRMVCVFRPPLVGPEVHDEHGAYPAPDDDTAV